MMSTTNVWALGAILMRRMRAFGTDYFGVDEEDGEREYYRDLLDELGE